MKKSLIVSLEDHQALKRLSVDCGISMLDLVHEAIRLLMIQYQPKGEFNANDTRPQAEETSIEVQSKGRTGPTKETRRAG